jgi:preprotein translocase subunit SecG
MRTKIPALSFFVTVLVLSLISLAAAAEITATIGNSRMVLDLNPGESVEKYILVKNSNEVPITIELTPSGDLIDTLVIKENNFTLAPGEEKKAYFTITASNSRATETKIYVKFIPEEGGSVGLASTILIFNPELNETDVDDDITGDAVDGDGSSISANLILAVSTLVLFVLLLILLVYYLKKRNSRKGARRPRA